MMLIRIETLPNLTRRYLSIEGQQGSPYQSALRVARVHRRCFNSLISCIGTTRIAWAVEALREYVEEGLRRRKAKMPGHPFLNAELRAAKVCRTQTP